MRFARFAAVARELTTACIQRARDDAAQVTGLFTLLLHWVQSLVLGSPRPPVKALA